MADSGLPLPHMRGLGLVSIAALSAVSSSEAANQIPTSLPVEETVVIDWSDEDYTGTIPSQLGV